MFEKVDRSQTFSKVLKLAYLIKANSDKYNPVTTWGDALRQAWKVVKFRRTIRKRTLCFTYKKSNGAVRLAKGHNIQNGNTYNFKSTGKNKAWNTLRYFDEEKQSYRSFDIRRLTEIQWK